LQRKLAVPRLKVKPLLGLVRAASILAGGNRPGPFKFLDEKFFFKYFLIAAGRGEKKDFNRKQKSAIIGNDEEGANDPLQFWRSAPG
jgi:hypothetical protein